MANIRLKIIDILNSPSNLNERGERIITQKQLSKKTGIREATISAIINQKVDKINRKHLAAIMKALEITDFNEILEIVDD